MDVGGKAGGKLQLTHLGSCLTLLEISILYRYNCYLTAYANQVKTVVYGNEV